MIQCPQRWGRNMYKIPFYIGSIVSWFVPGKTNRQYARGNVNVFFFYMPIARFIKRTYGVRARTIRLVRQVTTGRMTCVVNNRYYVKVFRDVSVKQLNDYKFLLNFIRPHLHVEIPNIFVAKHIPMYVADKLPGTDLRKFGKEQVVKHERKIKSQIFKMIDDMQNIPLKSIPNNERFLTPLQPQRHGPKSYQMSKNSVLAHQDLNASNLLLDDKFNVASVVDWDSLSIIPDADKDRKHFENLWQIYKKKN